MDTDKLQQTMDHIGAAHTGCPKKWRISICLDEILHVRCHVLTSMCTVLWRRAITPARRACMCHCLQRECDRSGRRYVQDDGRPHDHCHSPDCSTAAGSHCRHDARELTRQALQQQVQKALEWLAASIVDTENLMCVPARLEPFTAL